MALTLASVRQRPRGAELCIINGAGREIVLWMRGWTEDTTLVEIKAFAQAELDRHQAVKAEIDAEKADEEAEANVQAFKQWLSANATRPDVRHLLRPLVRIYRGET